MPSTRSSRPWQWILGGVLLAGVLALNAANLTSTPQVFGDEAWVTSIVWSASEGIGWKPALAAGAGLYEGVQDYSSPRIALLPNYLAELVLPTSVALHRAIVLVTSLGALGLFWAGMRRLLGGGTALIATAAVASTWAFFYMSHFARWDGVGLVILCGILALLVKGPPRLLYAGIAGLAVGLCLDFSMTVGSVGPGVLLLCAWAREDRWRRLGALAIGLAAGAGIAGLAHFAPGFDLEAARDQTDRFLRPQSGYLDTPVLEAVKHLSLQPILDDPQRYDHLTAGSYRVNMVFLPVGFLASILLMLRALRVPAAPLRIAGLAGVGLAALVLAFDDSSWVVFGDAMGPLLLVALGVAVWLAVDAFRNRRDYPEDAVPGILMAGLLVGWALLVGFKYGVYTGFAVIYSIAAVASALRALAPEGLRESVPAASLAAAAVASTLFVIGEIGRTPEEPATDGELAATARDIVPEGETVVGEWVYWWLYEDERFRANSVIWQRAWDHPDDTFADSFHRVCPDWVLLDPLWLGRYEAVESQRLFPNLSPTDPREKRRLKALLRSEYRPVETVDAEGRRLTFWQRRAAECPRPGESPRAAT